MLFAYFNKVFNTKAYQKKLNAERLEYVLGMKDALYSASKGVMVTSRSLYNFLKHEYEPFSLKEFKDMNGVSLVTYSPHSTGLLDFVRDIRTLNNAQYLEAIKSMGDHFVISTKMFGDWYDNDGSINETIGMMEDVVSTFLFYHDEDDVDQDDPDTFIGEESAVAYEHRVKEMDKLNRRYPGLYDFVQLKDYHNLVVEILNILVALYTINLRSLGETSQ